MLKFLIFYFLKFRFQNMRKSTIKSNASSFIVRDPTQKFMDHLPSLSIMNVSNSAAGLKLQKSVDLKSESRNHSLQKSNPRTRGHKSVQSSLGLSRNSLSAIRRDPTKPGIMAQSQDFTNSGHQRVNQ